MINRLLAILLLSTVALAGCGSAEQGDENASNQTTAANDAYEQLLKKRREVEPITERLAITKEFLDEFPESEHTANALAAVFYYQGEELGDMLGAITYAEEIRGAIDDPEIAKEVDKKLIGFYGESGATGKMITLADQLAAAGALDFDDHWNIIEGAVKAEEWKLVRDYCAKARGMTNAESYRADHPDNDLSEEEVAEAVNNRVGMLLVKDGWARANQGQIDTALADFAKADNLIPRYYFDIPEYDLNIYWAKTLLMRKKFEAAIERFAMSGLVMGEEEALTGLKEAYIGIHGSESGFEAYAAKLHLSIARTIDDFEMPDYEGNRHRFSDLRSDVTVLTLWFPT
ncbi:MAG: hypothetical protein GTO29_14890 [Candidatus Latescibacteria bacterium]|nr:hypothetical protein [Candidatus Latescibacterota bacterium]NIO57437.1 hypothetical protein [Candidatus Latescibacterota bacterium]